MAPPVEVTFVGQISFGGFEEEPAWRSRNLDKWSDALQPNALEICALSLICMILSDEGPF